jgi:hypothetical protein
LNADEIDTNEFTQLPNDFERVKTIIEAAIVGEKSVYILHTTENKSHKPKKDEKQRMVDAF